MQITRATLNRKFFLGNFETIDISAEAQLGPNESILDIWTLLRDNADNWFMTQMKAAAPGGSPLKEKLAAPKPASQTKPQPPQEGYDECPGCGGKKKRQYDLCYNCNMERKGNDQ